tara:strand:+ start:508 stop:1461 length:954 start_codon:yes stop_codon:yes gene_type:complete
MSNDVSIFDQNQLPAHLQGQEKNSTTDAMITQGESIPKISIKGKQFALKTKDAVTKLADIGVPISVVVIAIDPPNKHVAKSYFKGDYTGASENPDCSSANGVVPDSWVDSPVHTACATCPMNVFGAGKNNKGKDIRPCSDHKRLIVAQVGNIDGDLAAIQIPVMSLKNLSRFGRQLNKHNCSPNAVITELSFDQDAEYPQLVFSPKGFLSEDDYNKATTRAASSELQDLLNAAPAEGVPLGGAAELTPTLDAPEKSIDAGLEERLTAETPSIDGFTPKMRSKILVTTAKAGALTLEQFYAKGWTEEKLIANGYAEYK